MTTELERLVRPDCFDFAMDFLGGPEDEIVQTYVEALESENSRLRAALDFISTSGSGGEVYPCGPFDTEYAEDGNTVLRHVEPWTFLSGKGSTFLDAVEDAMKKTA